MTRKIVCDECGKDVPDIPAVIDVKLRGKELWNIVVTAHREGFAGDICKDCVMSLLNDMKG